MTETDQVTVIGGGAVGLCVAEALSARGVTVAVLERRRCGAGASAGNAGWITPSLSVPVPGPGVIAAALRWLPRASGPLWIRPTLAPAMLSWLAGFATACRPAAHARGLAVLQALAAGAGPAFDRLAERGAVFEQHAEDLLYPACHRAELAHLQRSAAGLRAAGATAVPEPVSPAELVALEPALSPAVIGGLRAGGEARVRPETLIAALLATLAARGVEVAEEVPVTALRRDGRRWLAVTPGGSRPAGAVVVTTGADVALLSGLGVPLPVIAAKGYSRTFARAPGGPRRALYLHGPRVAVSPFADAVRISGGMDLGARGTAPSARRLRAIAAAAQVALPGWPMPAAGVDWAGLRPLSPDGLPDIGAVAGHPGLYVATGHGMLGITLAPLTGEMLAGVILDGHTPPALAALDPARRPR